VTCFFYWSQSDLLIGHKVICLFYWSQSDLFIGHKVTCFFHWSQSDLFIGHKVTCLVTKWPMRLHYHYPIHCFWSQSVPCF